jgi:hypothetical protein
MFFEILQGLFSDLVGVFILPILPTSFGNLAGMATNHFVLIIYSFLLFTPADSKLAISFKNATADCTKGKAKAQPVPSPKRN